MQILVLLVVAAVVIALLVHYWYVCVVVAALISLPRIIRRIKKNRYFGSEAFLRHKEELTSVVAEHNEIVSYTSEIRRRGFSHIGASSSGSQAHLAAFENTSHHAYRRDRNMADYAGTNVHNCSLQVVRNAAADPLTYLTKYFRISADESVLADVEELGENISRLEDAVGNLRQRETGILGSFDPPAFILKHYRDEFMRHVGVEFSPVSVPYPEYFFEYVSAGGNSAQRTSIKLDTPKIDALIERLSEKIRFSTSAAGQRALMTAKLRGFIKQRDN